MISPPKTKNEKIPSINNPLSGSKANAWTEVRIPERTKKVPNKLAANAKIDSNSDQFINMLRFSVTSSEWTKATAKS